MGLAEEGVKRFRSGIENAERQCAQGLGCIVLCQNVLHILNLHKMTTAVWDI
jgi:hypothetical protein